MNTSSEIDYKKYPILYIDDLKKNLESFKETFEEEFTIFVVESGQQALELLAKEHITLVLADQRMPELTGVEFFKMIKEKYPSIIRILITAYSDIDAVIAAINEGKVYSYIGKPVKNEDIRERIKQGIYTYYITEERDRLYQEKLDAVKRLASANRLNAAISMASGFADRLNNYIVAIKFFFDSFPGKIEKLDSQLNQESKDILNTLYYPSTKDVEKMLKLSSEINSFCRPPKYDFQKQDPKIILNIVDEIADNLKSDIENKQIKITKEIEGNPPSIYFDRNSIKLVLCHLIQNAIHAIPENKKGSILVKISGPIHKSGREFVRITVQDNGIGIPEKDKENIFNPFFTTKGTSGGLGLGLMTCQFIITHHDGEIEVAQTELEKGTTMYIDLPIKKEPPKDVIDYIDILGMFPARRGK